MFSVRQRSALSGFTYELFDNGNKNVGSMCWPDLAIARNARFDNPFPGLLSTTIELTYSGQLYIVEYEYLKRDWFNDIRFTLLCEGTVIAAADVLQSKKWFTRSTITIVEPFSGAVVRKSGVFTTRYQVMNGKEPLGTVAEKGGLTVKRELIIDLPNSISAPVQFFVFFLVHNHAYR